MPTYVASNGDDFLVRQNDRSYKGKIQDILKVDGNTGTLTVANLTNSGTSTVAALSASGNATVGGTLAVTGNATVGGTLAVTGNTTMTGTLTVGGKTPATGTFYSVVEAGKNGAGALTLTGTKVGDKVIAVANLTTPGDLQSSFETTITVANQIQQSSATDLSAKQILFILNSP